MIVSASFDYFISPCWAYFYWIVVMIDGVIIYFIGLLELDF